MSMMRKRVIAIIAAALAIVILAVSLAAVMQYVDIIEFVDVDKTKYYARKVDGEYKLFAELFGSKEPLPLAENENYNGYYVTKAGTLVLIDPETGEATDYIPVESEETEDQVEFNNRVLIFPHIEKKDLLSLEVHNTTGSYTFERRDEDGEITRDGTFIIKGSPLTVFDQTLFSSLHVGAGYTLTVDKILPIKRDASGAICQHKDDEDCGCVKDFSEYGLVSEVRERQVVDEKTGEVVIDEETGEPKTETYNYEPAYYIIESENEDGERARHKVILGDALVTGGGYYALYVDISGETEEIRDRAVYVLDNDTGTSVLSPIETYVTPMLNYPLSMNRYYDVDNFTITQREIDEYVCGAIEKEDDASTPDKNEESYYLLNPKNYEATISFTYVDLSEREYTMAANTPYKFKLGLEGYGASDSAINSCMYNLYSPSLAGTVKYAPTMDDLVEYGFFVEQLDKNGNPMEGEYEMFSKYTISYSYDILDDDGKAVQRITQFIMISDRDYDTTGNYYTYTYETRYALDENGVISDTVMPFYGYDFIVEAEGHMFGFLRWDEYDWVNPSIVDQNISFLTDIKLTSPEHAYNYSASFKVYNPLAEGAEATKSDMLYVNATDSVEKHEDKHTFSVLNVVDKNQIQWTITSTDITVYDLKKQKDVKIKDGIAFYDYNDLDMQVLCRTGYIECANTLVEVTNNRINVYDKISKGDGGYEKGALIESYLRYDTNLFRKYYQTLLYSTIEGSYTVTEEQEASIVTDDNLLLTLEISFKDAEAAGGTETTNVYKFYKIQNSSRKVYITVNGNGGFYLNKSRVEKLVTDANNFFENVDFEPDAKR